MECITVTMAIINRILNKIESQKQAVLLHLVVFENPKNVSFIDFPLSIISFLLTDVSDAIIVTKFDKEEKILSEVLLEKFEDASGDIDTLFRYVENNEMFQETAKILKKF